MANKDTFKLFISQPMTGLTDEQIIHDRELGLQKFYKINNEDGITGKEIEVINNLQMDGVEKLPLQYLGYDISAMAEANAVFFLSGWEIRKGCMIEFMVAREYGIDMYFEQ